MTRSNSIPCIPAFGCHTPRSVHREPRNKVVRLRSSQRTAFLKLRGSRFGILNGPTGWGKSLVLCALAGDDLQTKRGRKIVVCIPQTVIAKGFVNSVEIQLPNGNVLRWRVNNDLCQPSPSKVDRLARFLLAPAKADVADRVIVVTHLGLASAFGKLAPEEQILAIQNTTFLFDEAHHLQASDEAANRLGGILAFILESRDTTVRVFLATAFFFRG